MRQALLSAAFCTVCTLGAITPSRADTVDTTGAASAAPLAPLSWGRVQGRMAFATGATPLRTDLNAADTTFKVSSLSLMGDYFLRPSLSQLTLGGFRATSGVVFGQRSALWGMSSPQIGGFGVDRRSGGYDSGNYDHTTTPYLGLGYSGTGGSYGKSGSWGFSADLGLMSLSPGNIGRFGKVVNGSQNLDDMVRDLRLSPVLQFGFNYAF
jgi:hypothetical protein